MKLLLASFCLVASVTFVVGFPTADEALKIISREQWGAKPPKQAPSPLKEIPPPYVIISHTATNFCYTQSECTLRVRSTQTDHMASKGWDDIGYNFLVGGDGNVYEGRGWDVAGAHTLGYNAKSIGISFIGAFGTTLPTSAQLAAAQNLLQFGLENSKLSKEYKLLGHRQVSSTQSPELLKVISRAEWGAQPPKLPPERLKEIPAPYVIISHTTTDFCFTQAQCAMYVRFTQTFHMESQGWNDIGYNFLVGGDGNAYEGRGWNIEGAHTFNFNYKSIGISFIGTFDNVNPTKAQLHAALKLIEIGVQAGKISKDYKLLGHRQCTKTESPGQKLYETIQTWDHWVPEP